MYRVVLQDLQTDEEYKVMLTEEQVKLLTYLGNTELPNNGFTVAQCCKDDFEVVN